MWPAPELPAVPREGGWRAQRARGYDRRPRRKLRHVTRCFADHGDRDQIGSGTSTSGGKDDNGDAGGDKMPESNRTVRPESQPHHPEDK
ncbi:hypothetical protein [Bradyrhizobium japonicum]|uniref:hypothetical protein n=1 Tax=Bradyrhizobium japonicum TaxID=375 RepID=UPI000456E959|nr:hypothetical protein [Bradyrhizobium japonicum]AHY52549.1 hypothetical protein BJS_08972 [Bradyrhizobium japonicum SEMIA 5079]MCD9110196.1 hypothetical protein [Bradyrhizobium japonicum]MCD9258445.1 hypothetical protein [Bradyrhizobium japonicum SEMIA 5079]MCD9823436.1 hypothetical protein [Bradyrhizobium japonicum]MCD9895037.1 hypothetical protein [Bradyrhizobium japonicum]